MSRAAFDHINRAADAPAPEGPARVASPERIATRPSVQAQKSNITPGHRLVFNALTSGLSGEFALMSAFVNDAPAALIVAAREKDEGVLEIMPLFVSPTSTMRVTGHDGDIIWKGGE